jgi:hypothetical protein
VLRDAGVVPGTHARDRLIEPGMTARIWAKIAGAAAKAPLADAYIINISLHFQ